MGLEQNTLRVLRVWHPAGSKLVGPMSLLELYGAPVGVECDRALRNPSESFSKAIDDSIKEDSTEAEYIIDGPIFGQ